MPCDNVPVIVRTAVSILRCSYQGAAFYAGRHLVMFVDGTAIVASMEADANGDICLNDWNRVYGDWSELPRDAVDEIVARARSIIGERVTRIDTRIAELRDDIDDYLTERATLAALSETTE